jgi:MFS family permease
VNPGVKTINVVTMLLVEFTGMLAMTWWSASMIFYIQNELDVPVTELQTVSSNATSVVVFGSIFLNIVMGVIYDTIGRKAPIVIFLAITSMAFSSFPFLKNEKEFYLAAVFLIALPIINTNPFVADLIQKESYGIGNMLRSNSINLSNLTAYVLLMLNASYPDLFCNDFIYLCLTAMLLSVTSLVVVGMKDVVKEEQQRTERISVKYVLKQSYELISTEPIILLGIAGSVIQICTKIIGNGTTTLAIQYYFSQ